MSMTTPTETTVDAAGFSVRRTVTIAASLEKVWDAITQPEHIVGWFGQRAEIDSLTVGARGVFGFEGYGDFPVRVERIEPPHVVAYRWSNDDANPLDPDDVVFEHSTVFTFTLEPLPRDDGSPVTQLTVVETGFDTLANPAVSMESNRGGWNAEIDQLIAYLEGA